MRTEQEIRESLAEMQRMESDAERVLSDLNHPVKESPFLIDMFSKWKERCSARVSILKWVLELPYLDDDNDNPSKRLP